MAKVKRASNPKRKKEHKQASEVRSRDPMRLEMTRQKLADLLEQMPKGFGRAQMLYEVLIVQEKSGYTWRQILGMDSL
jgi:hypothetical protein